MGDTIDDEFGPIGFVEATTYHASVLVQLVRAIALVVGGIAALNTARLLAIIPLVLIAAVWMVFSLLDGLPAEGGWPASMIAVLIAIDLLISAIASLIAWVMLRFAFTAPTRITLADDGLIVFRGWWRTIELHPADIHSVATGAWYGPRRCSVAVRYQGGAIAFLNLFHDFPDFLHRLKALNPAVDVKGF